MNSSTMNDFDIIKCIKKYQVFSNGIIKNKNNIIANAYQLTPIPITVEGSNILTRSLIIYGQGLIKSHKYIYNIVECCENNNLIDFKKNINNLTLDVVKILSKMIITKKDNASRTDRLSRQYAILSYMCLLNYGGKLKTKEYISGRMADILCDLYKSYSILWLCTHLRNNKKVEEETLKLIEDYCINNIHNKIIDNINIILNDIRSPIKYLFVFNNKKILNYDKSITNISNLFLSDNKLKDILTENVYVPNDITDIRYKLLNHKYDKKIIEEIIKVN